MSDINTIKESINGAICYIKHINHQQPHPKKIILKELESSLSILNKTLNKTKPHQPTHCQNGRSDICLASQKDNVICADDECDIDMGVRENHEMSISYKEFEKWWNNRGRFFRDGGGEYEKSFAFWAWIQARKNI